MPSMERPTITDEDRALVELCCSLSMRAHRSATSPFLAHALLGPSPCSVFAFPASWAADDWIASSDGGNPFGEAAVDPSLFPSLKRVGNDVLALVNAAFLRYFQKLLKESQLQAQVHRAIHEKKRIVFTGHSSGGSISSLATVWLLEHIKSSNNNQVSPLCVTFGSPLVGDGVFCHALQREDWSSCFVHFTMALDIVPRVLLAPLSSFREEFQAFLHFLHPKSLCFSLNSIGKSQLVSSFFSTVLRNALSISNQRACLSMGCTNPLLAALSNFVKFTPYRPFGTYIFCNRNRLVGVKNSDAILHLLCYCLQWTPEQDLTEVACSSLKEHLQYELKVKELLEVQTVFYVDNSEGIPFSLDNEGFDEIEGLELSMDARLSLCAASEWEKQRQRNQARVDTNYSKIQESLNKLNEYRATCEIRGLGYYDTFKLQQHEQDFNANVKRLELAGLWDEIVEMLARNELPDNFEGRDEWVKLGTSYRLLVEPLDIANYYRHSKNEDTGPYMVKGRPKRYRYTQRWLQHAQKNASGSSLESCFWAIVEELCIETSNSKSFEDIRERVLDLENEVSRWLATGKLGRDVLLNGSTFLDWWKTLPKQHKLESCIERIMNDAAGLQQG